MEECPSFDKCSFGGVVQLPALQQWLEAGVMEQGLSCHHCRSVNVSISKTSVAICEKFFQVGKLRGLKRQRSPKPVRLL